MKNLVKVLNLIFLIGGLIFVFSNCGSSGGSSDGSSDEGSNIHGEIYETVDDFLNDYDLCYGQCETGSNPPWVEGDYDPIDVICTYSDWGEEGQPLGTHLKFTNQTSDNKIDYEEYYQGELIGEGKGYFIRGDKSSGRFTIYQQTKFEYNECIQYGAATFTCTKVSYGLENCTLIWKLTAYENCSDLLSEDDLGGYHIFEGNFSQW